MTLTVQIRQFCEEPSEFSCYGGNTVEVSERWEARRIMQSHRMFSSKKDIQSACCFILYFVLTHVLEQSLCLFLQVFENE